VAEEVTMNGKLMSRRRVARMLAVVPAVAAAVAVAPAAAQAACTSPTFSVYPGSGISNVRYGQVDFHFTACSNQAPSAWAASVGTAQVNSTGKNLGFFIDGVSIPTDSIGSSTRYWTGKIAASTCTPRVGFPCSRSYSMTVKFSASLDRFGNPQIYMGTRSAPTGMALFTTP
jgi:hypothetical protein